MKLSQHASGIHYLVSGHGPGWIEIAGQRHERSLLISEQGVDAGWGPAPGEPLSAAHLAALAGRGMQLVLIGTGQQQRFPPAEVLRPLIDAGVGFEVMDTGAACRTYNLLVSEGRGVIAALIVE
jgi:uncharacterized protein